MYCNAENHVVSHNWRLYLEDRRLAQTCRIFLRLLCSVCFFHDFSLSSMGRRSSLKCTNTMFIRHFDLDVRGQNSNFGAFFAFCGKSKKRTSSVVRIVWVITQGRRDCGSEFPLQLWRSENWALGLEFGQERVEIHSFRTELDNVLYNILLTKYRWIRHLRFAVTLIRIGSRCR